MQSVSSNAVADAISVKNVEHQVGYWLGIPMYEKIVSVPIENYTTTFISKSINTEVTGIVTVVEFGGIYIKGEWNTPVWVMNVPYSYFDTAGTGKYLMIYCFYDKPNNRFQVTLGGTYQNGYYGNGRIYIKFRYIKTTTPVA